MITFVLYRISKQKYCSLFLLFVILIVHSNWNYFEKNLKITMIDVGQGDSILIELPYNKGNILIDTGGIIIYENDQFKSKRNTH